jgi:hypothetical protein
MKKERLFSLLAAVVLITAGSLSAQTYGSPVKANIPFDFEAGNKHFSAGEQTGCNQYAECSVDLWR